MTETFGSVYVNSPQIYTRERLVNDRFVHDAWLREQLGMSDTLAIAPSERIRQELQFEIIHGSPNTADGVSKATSATGDQEQAQTETGTAPVELSPLDIFEARNSYRAQVRGQIIENQLDDRHDLQGNSLYLFKFDVAVLPGSNTTSSARITIEMKGVPSYSNAEKVTDSSYDAAELVKEVNGVKKYALDFYEKTPALDIWQQLYDDWWQNIGIRLNTTMSDLLKAYRNDRFPLEYYREIFWSIASSKSVPYPALNDEVLTCLDSLWAEKGIVPGIKHQRIRSMISILEVADSFANFRQMKEPERNENTLNAIEPAADSFCETLVNEEAANEFQQGHYYRQLPINKPKIADNTVIEFVARKATEIVLGSDTRVSIAGLTDGASNGTGVTDSTPGSLDPYLGISFLKGTSLSEPGFFGVQPRVVELWLSPLEKGERCPSSRPSGAADPIMLAYLAAFELRYMAGPRPRKGTFCLQLQRIEDKSGKSTVQEPYYHMTQKLVELALEKIRYFKAYDEVSGGGITVPTGLFNFVEAISRVDTYSYSVTPKREYDVSLVESSLSSLVGGNTRPADGDSNSGTSITASGKRQLESLRENVSIVSFGSAPIGDKSASTTFGWVFSPTVTDSYDGRRRFTPVQRSVYALLSVPAWWSKVHITVHKAWTDDAGRPVETERWATPMDNAPETVPVQEYTIPLPVDYEAIDLIVLGATRRSPEVYAIGLEQPIHIAACRPADILLPGKRLWRSTIVTLGGQVADRITVLPSMRGIIAHFGRVEIPPALTDLTETAKLPVTVWTSEGQYSLASEAEVRIPHEIQQLMETNHLPDCPASAGLSGATVQ